MTFKDFYLAENYKDPNDSTVGDMSGRKKNYRASDMVPPKDLERIKNLVETGKASFTELAKKYDIAPLALGRLLKSTFGKINVPGNPGTGNAGIVSDVTAGKYDDLIVDMKIGGFSLDDMNEYLTGERRNISLKGTLFRRLNKLKQTNQKLKDAFPTGFPKNRSGRIRKGYGIGYKKK